MKRRIPHSNLGAFPEQYYPYRRDGEGIPDIPGISAYDPDTITKYEQDVPVRNITGIGSEAVKPSPSDIIYQLLRDNYQFADATPFRKIASVNVNLTTFMTVVSFQVPIGMRGVLKFFGQGAATTLAFNELTWQLLVNGTPATDFGSFTVQFGSISSPKPITERLKSGDIVELKANIVTTAYVAVGLLEGWYWSDTMYGM